MRTMQDEPPTCHVTERQLHRSMSSQTDLVSDAQNQLLVTTQHVGLGPGDVHNHRRLDVAQSAVASVRWQENHLFDHHQFTVTKVSTLLEQH
jgi:hypothetical protein